MRVLGLDLSLTSSGWSCAGRTGTLVTKETGPGRLFLLKTQLRDLIFEYTPDLIVIENYSFASKNSRAHAIGEWGGVARLLIWEMTYAYVEVPPNSRAKFATGKGNASKGEVMSSVSARTGIVWSGKGAEDQCDAWILEEMALCQHNKARHDWPALNKSALEAIDWNPISRYPQERNT